MAQALRLSMRSPAVVLEFMHPITWFAPMWAFGCGVVSSGHAPGARWPVVLAGVVLAGPLVCGTSQAINDWFDRHVDAINEPDRPIPSGRLPGQWGLIIAVVATGLSLLVATVLGPVGFAAGVVGLVLAWAYSAPPLRLKQNGWLGNAVCGACYEGLPWITGAAVASGLVPSWRIFLVAALYSAGAHGIMTLNDFKSIEGDRRTGVRSLPAHLGVRAASRLACIVMVAPQVVVAGLLYVWGAWIEADAVALLVFAQVALMPRFLRDPRGQAPWYNGTGTLLYVLGMLASAIALGGAAP